MKLEGFLDLLDRHGADPDAWPADTRPGIEALLRESAAARGELAAARSLDAALSRLPPHRVTPGLQARIARSTLDSTSASTLDRFIDWLTAALWRPALLGLAPLLLGAAVGIAIPGSDGQVEALSTASILLDEVYANYE